MIFCVVLANTTDVYVVSKIVLNLVIYSVFNIHYKFV